MFIMTRQNVSLIKLDVQLSPAFHKVQTLFEDISEVQSQVKGVNNVYNEAEQTLCSLAEQAVRKISARFTLTRVFHPFKIIQSKV